MAELTLKDREMLANQVILEAETQNIALGEKEANSIVNDLVMKYGKEADLTLGKLREGIIQYVINFYFAE